MNAIMASSTQTNLLIYVGGGGFVLLGSFFFGRLVTFFFPKNQLIRNVKKEKGTNVGGILSINLDTGQKLQKNGLTWN